MLLFSVKGKKGLIVVHPKPSSSPCFPAGFGGAALDTDKGPLYFLSQLSLVLPPTRSPSDITHTH